jgi:hypothetical protein
MPVIYSAEPGAAGPVESRFDLTVGVAGDLEAVPTPNINSPIRPGLHFDDGVGRLERMRGFVAGGVVGVHPSGGRGLKPQITERLGRNHPSHYRHAMAVYGRASVTRWLAAPNVEAGSVEQAEWRTSWGDVVLIESVI